MNERKKTYVIAGENFSTLEKFYDEISRVLIPDAEWGHNLDALNDILRGGFGTPPEGFILVWKNSALSRQRLGYPETVRQLELRLARCDPSNRPSVQAELEQAKQDKGPTVFDWLVEEAEDGVELVLE